MKTDYRFVLEVQDLDGHQIHSETLSPDWEPAIEAVRLVGLRADGRWSSEPESAPQLEPLWHDTEGEPRLQGFRVCLNHGPRLWSADFTTSSYFVDAARAMVAARLANGQLKADDRVHYTVSAYASDAKAHEPAAARFDAADLPQPLAVRDRGLAALVSRSQSCGDVSASDIEVIVPANVLDEMEARTLEAGECETGGILIGHLCRDDARGDVGLEVTAQIPARHTVGDSVKLTFTSDTWTDVRAAVALRNAGELLVGWWHSHPAQAWCKACPVDRQRVCHLKSGFLSTDDRTLHRAMFPGAYTQALLVTNSIDGLETKLFGWREGVLQARGFRLLAKGESHATPTAAGD